MWATKGHIMLGKCAESLALRKAFPAEMAGVYTNEEMSAADNVIDVKPERKSEELPIGMKPAVAPTEPQDAQGDAQEPEGDAFVPVDVKIKDGTSKTGKPYRKYGIVHPDGRTLGTFDKDLGDLAAGAMQTKKAIKVEAEQVGNFWNIKTLALV